MKKTFLVIALTFGMLFSASMAQPQKKNMGGSTEQQQNSQQGPQKKEMPAPTPETKKGTAKTTAASKNMMKGKVMSLAGYVSGKMTDGSFKDNDQPLVLVTGQGKASKIYFIYNSDGTYAGKKLMSFSPNKMVNVSGKTKTVNGLNVIYADAIQSAE